MKRNLVFLWIVLLLVLSGCHWIYPLLQKEGAQEKELLGEVIPNQQNETVGLVQRLLRVHGFFSGTADGKLGPMTRDAIAAFQHAKGLEVSRFVDRATWKALNLFSESGLIRDGEINILTVQQALSSQGLDPGKLDGKMGPATKNAVFEFQTQNKLKADGKIGPQTLEALHRLKTP